MDINANVLDFLVSSRARRRLLQLLWAQGESGSVSELAKSARVGFASAYRELRAMQSLGLVVSERKDRADVYRANLAHPLAGAMRALVTSPARPPEDAEAQHLRGQLKALGAPLVHDSSEASADAVEEAVVRGVKLAHRDPDVARTLPVCLYRQRDNLRAERMRHYALHFGEKRSLGFFLELTAMLSGDDRFAAWAKSLRDHRCKATLDFFHTASRSHLQRSLSEAKTPDVARRWGLRMNMDLDAFRSTFEKFVDAA